METKLCTKCGQVKPVSEFGKNKSKKDGLQSHCKECVKIYKKKHYEENKEQYKIRNQSYREHNRDRLNRYKETLKCSVCGESRIWCLDFHHTDPNTKENNISSLIDYPIKLQEELEKCVILCANCHRDLHHKQNTVC